MSILKFKKADCKNCYKCVRNCPVKAIEVKDHQARIIESDCILCGNCMMVCPQNAKEVRNDILKVKNLIGEGKNVIASVAPSFISNYSISQFSQFSSVLKRLGFANAFETAQGAYLVKSQYERLVENHWNDIVISSCCSTVVKLIQKCYPEALKYLAPIISPMQAHGKIIKSEIENAFVVFIGPCISKKSECENHYGATDIAIAFEELNEWIDEVGLEFSENKNYDKNFYISRNFPVSGGILKTMKRDEDYTYVAIDGLENCITALKEIINGKITNCFVEMSACNGSCINGPASVGNSNSLISSITKVGNISENKDVKVDFNLNYKFDMNIDIQSEQVIVQPPSEKNILDILKRIGKKNSEDELNCGTCGYSTCREKAIAVFWGKAEISMCLPYMKEKAESFSDKIISITPNAIITVNIDLNVQQINKAACEIFEIYDPSDIIGSPVSRIMDDFDFIHVISSEKGSENKKTYLAEYGKYIDQVFVYDKNSDIVICIMKDITKAELRREKIINKKNNTADITDRIVEKHMRIVHEIASLLGETAAETKIALTELKETILLEEEEYD